MKTIATILFLFISFFSFNQVNNLETKVYNLIKNYKLKLNGDDVVICDKISTECEKYSNLMIKNNILEHDPNLGYQSEIIQKTNNINCTEDELAKKILNNFLNSKVHKEIIEDISRKIGIGIVTQNNYVWVTIRFE
jgi:hypothetical protein